MKDYTYKTLYQKITTTDAGAFADVILSDAQFLNPQNFEVKPRGTYKVSNRSHPMEITAIQRGFQAMLSKNGKVSRLEEWICKSMLGKTEALIGAIADYQIPLKAPNTTKEEKEGLGKVDLLSNNADTGMSYLLELKVEDSSEHPLKAITEAYTYWQMLGGDNASYFLENSHASEKRLDKAILIYKDSKLHNKLKKCAKTQAVIKKLDVKCFFVESLSDGLHFKVVGEWK